MDRFFRSEKPKNKKYDAVVAEGGNLLTLESPLAQHVVIMGGNEPRVCPSRTVASWHPYCFTTHCFTPLSATRNHTDPARQTLGNTRQTEAPGKRPK